ncbi:phage tail tape measure protein [Vibrio hibernica]|uniref:phage tail tape measure protein n=1 Tax=Vibrio hibernica TaxID=2587465 RepID=UPI0039B01451
MTHQITLNEYIYILLIEKNLNGFTVLNLRDEFLKITDSLDPNEARKYVYRHLLHLERNGFLLTKGQGRKRTYHHSDKFKSTEFKPKAFISKKTIENSPKNSSIYSELEKEKHKFEGELAITLEEIDECKALAERLPSHKKSFISLAEAKREISVKYLAKVNVLNQALNFLVTE